LIQEEIQNNMREIEFHSGGLIGRWGLEEGSGLIAYDSSGNGNDGIVILAEWELTDLPALENKVCSFQPTPEINGLLLRKQGLTTLEWDYAGFDVYYDVTSGLLSLLREEQGAQTAACLMDDAPDPFYTDDSQPDPAALEGYYYLIRSERVCSGSYGASSSGSDRLPTSPCP